MTPTVGLMQIEDLNESMRQKRLKSLTNRTKSHLQVGHWKNFHNNFTLFFRHKSFSQALCHIHSLFAFYLIQNSHSLNSWFILSSRGPFNNKTKPRRSSKTYFFFTLVSAQVRCFNVLEFL